MQKRTITGFIVALISLMLAACAAKTATPVSFADVCKLENDHKQLSTVGYFDPGISVFCSDTGGDYRCSFDFLESVGSENKFSADLLEGNGKNQLAKLPDDYSNEDVKIKTDDGTVIGVEQKARISGEMLITEGVCLMEVHKIEAVTD